MTDESAVPVAAFSALLAVLAPAGIALMNAGLVRSRAAAHTLFLALCSFCASAAAFGAIGVLWMHVNPLHWNAGPNKTFELLIQAIGCGLCASIAIGSGAERWRTAACLVTAAVLGIIIVPVAYRMLGHGVDAAFGGAVQATGGLNALAVTWILGPRRGKYNSAGMPNATPGHSGPFIIFGAFAALSGFLGWNIACSAMFADAPIQKLPLVALITLLCGCCGALGAGGVSHIRFGKPDASLAANGFLAGLAASCAGCAVIPPLGAVLVGLAAGGSVVYSIELCELRLRIDDPAGAASVHAVSGIWGLIAAAVFAPQSAWAPLLVDLCALAGLFLPLLYCLQLVLRRFAPYRVPAEAERQGMDLSELGAGAYPDFMIHRDDFGFR